MSVTLSTEMRMYDAFFLSKIECHVKNLKSCSFSSEKPKDLQVSFNDDCKVTAKQHNCE